MTLRRGCSAESVLKTATSLEMIWMNMKLVNVNAEMAGKQTMNTLLYIQGGSNMTGTDFCV